MPDSYEKQLFPTWGLQVTGVWGWTFDRRIEITLSNGGAIWIKWFGRNGNILYHDGQHVHSVFRRSHQGDYRFTPHVEGRIDSASKEFPAIYATELGSIAFNSQERKLFASPLELLFWWKHAGVYVDPTHGSLPDLCPAVRPEVSALPLLEGCTHYSRQYAALYSFQQIRESTLEYIHQSSKLLGQKIVRLQSELNGLQDAGDYRKQANSLLTYPDRIQPNASLVRLPDCESPERTLSIRIDPSLSPPENADRLFAKSKRQHLQREHLQQQLDQKKSDLSNLKQALDLLSEVNDPKRWRQMGTKLRNLTLPPNILLAFGQKSSSSTARRRPASTEPTHLARKLWYVHLIDAWEVWVGRDAQGNTELLRQAHKNDIWMHARGHSGSHVLIRSAGKPVPADVMLQAARLAARHSKGRGEEVCAVSHTQRKFVTPVKGGPAGKVRLDREEVIFSRRSDVASS